MPSWPKHHGRRCRKDMLYNEKQDVRVRRWNWLLLFCLPLALVVSANGTALDKRIPKRGSRQELPFEKRLEAEQRLSDLGYWTGPVDGNLDPGLPARFDRVSKSRRSSTNRQTNEGRTSGIAHGHQTLSQTRRKRACRH
jgi:hypothetical protein